MDSQPSSPSPRIEKKIPIRKPTIEFGARPIASVNSNVPPPLIAPESALPESSSVWNSLRHGPLKVAIIGSGNWGMAVSRIIGKNVQKSYLFHKTVNMYVYEEIVNGRKLTEIINTDHENVKYLPGIKIPENVVAYSNPAVAAKGANILIFVLPHQFIPNVCKQLQGSVGRFCKAISLVKGIICRNNKANLISDEIIKHLGVDCCVLAGANVANDIAREQFSETTIGYRNLETASLFQQLFDTPYFRVNLINDVPGVEICGALKNIVALAAGFIDGLKLGSNTKASIIRLGMVEMRKFAHTFFDGILEETFFDSCGFADVITTCYGGRNRACAEAFITSGKSWHQIELEMLSGQKLQGTGTTAEVYEVLVGNNLLDEFPLFATTYRVAFKGANPMDIVTCFQSDIPRPPEQYVSPKQLLQITAAQHQPAQKTQSKL